MGRSDRSSTPTDIDIDALGAVFKEAADLVGIDGSLASAKKVYMAHSGDAASCLYGLYKIATEGRCNVKMPKMENKFERYLFQSWRSLSAKLSPTTAKRLFIKSVKHLLPSWDVTIPVPIVDPSTDTHAEVESAATDVVVNSESNCLEPRGLRSLCIYDVWIPPLVRGNRPIPRSQHGCAIVGDKMYIFGGKGRGGYLSDLQALDLTSYKWSKIKTKGMPAVSAPHSLIAWNNKLLSVVGLEKVISVGEFDTQSHTWRCMETYGSPPTRREGLSVTLVGEMLIIYGGEDYDGKCPVENLNMLNLNTLKWDNCADIHQDVSSSPSPRSFHIAASYLNRYFYIFGGKQESLFLNDLHILDLYKRQWFKPDVQGENPCPRAFHAGVAIEQYWFTVGGGHDDMKGDMKMVRGTSLFNMETKSWSVLTNNEREISALTRLGMTLVSHVYEGKDFLLTFGGRNNNCYYKEINVLKSSHRDDHESRRKTDLQAMLIKEVEADEELLPEAALDEWMRTYWSHPLGFAISISDFSEGEASVEAKYTLGMKPIQDVGTLICQQEIDESGKRGTKLGEKLKDKQRMSMVGETNVPESSHYSTRPGTVCANENPSTFSALRSVFENPTAEDLSTQSLKSVLREPVKLGSQAAVSELGTFFESMWTSSVPTLAKGI